MAVKSFIYQFDNVRVEAREFRVFKNDEAITLEPKAFTVLVFLIENRGRLVTKDDLLDALWKDSFVTPNVLTRIVAQLRRALGDAPNNSRYIETVPTRGYRFIAEVEEIGARNKAEAVSDKTLAVLPFKLLNPNDESNYLSVGLADSLITKLSNIRRLTVRPTSSVMRYAGETDAGSAGRELKVETVIDGAVQQAGDRVRVSVRLVRASDGKPLWGNTYDTQFVNIFQVQDEISARIAEALRIQLSGDEQARLTQQPTDNLEAYQLYLRGNFHLYQFTPDGLQKAIQFFNQAIALDANYALAYAGLANAYGIASSFGDDSAALRAEAAAQKAVALDPTLAETHAALAAIFFWQKRDAAKALESFNRALELNPNSSVAHHYYSWFLIATARFDKAEQHLRRALELDPLSPGINVDQGLPFFFSRRYTEARARYEQALKTDSNFGYAHLRLGEACEGADDLACAVSGFERAAAFPGGDSTVKTQLARALALAGKKDDARRILDQLTTKDAPRSSPYFIALAFAALDEPDKAFENLNRALAEQDKWIGWTKVDPRLDTLRQDARFNDFLRRANLK
ncbi:MAG: winged helix-turn-helix domain-containing protein [Pyrinomonadaceae bacterium]